MAKDQMPKARTSGQLPLQRSAESKRSASAASNLSAPTISSEESLNPLSTSDEKAVAVGYPEFADVAEAVVLAARSQDSLERTIDADQVDTSDDSVVSVRGSELLPLRDWDLYRITGFLGAGGMGTVYRATDRRLNRAVAIKLLYLPEQSDLAERQRQRFIREAQAQARIEHPHICKIYEVDEVEGQPYIAMQLIEGQPLATFYTVMSREQKVRLMQQVADAIHAAHRLGIIHRDIKPGNIMVEQRADGSFWPYVMDFGLAREVDAKGSTGTIEGTPAFMSPEQARGEINRLDARTDVYGLGATLYALLAGRPPFVGSSTEVLLDVLLNDPPELRSIDPLVPVDLDLVVRKCMQKEPADRYPSALALAGDLSHYLDGDPISVQPATARHQLRRWIGKHRLAVALSAVVLLCSVVFAAVALRARFTATRQAELAQQLGQDIKEMELFMRYAYSLPLHDIGREQVVVRERIAKLQARKRQAPHEANGPLYSFAIGRGHWVLRELDEAQSKLESAWLGGYQIPEVRLALGQVLLEKYRRGLEQLSLLSDPALQAKQEAELAECCLTPGLAHLENGLAATESPTYVQGLIAFYQRDFALALSLAKQAQALTPWLPEPLRLEGDIYHAQAVSEMAAGRRAEARQHLDLAALRHAAAVAIAGSDASLHAAEAHDFLRTMALDAAEGKALDASTQRALGAIARATTASPTSLPLRQAQLHIYYQFYAWALFGKDQANMPIHYSDILSQAIPVAKKAVELLPKDGAGYQIWAAALGQICRRRLLATPCSAEEASQVVMAARNAVAHPVHGGLDGGAMGGKKGRDPAELLREALVAQYINLLLVDVEPSVVTHALLQAKKDLMDSSAHTINSATSILLTVQLLMWQSMHELLTGKPAALTLEAGLKTVDKALAVQPQDGRIHAAQALLLSLSGQAQGMAAGAAQAFSAARVAAEKAIELAPSAVESHEALAEVLRHASAWEIAGPQNAASKKRVAAQIERGLAACQAGLSLSPQRAPLIGTKGALLLLQARTTKKPKEQRALAERAVAALEHALALNSQGLIAKELQPLLAAARALR
ncbi:MAG: serine/threonine protein kinase [Myxococcales bacterium]|nr:serine/threonine protein kinase [Myxococcales bacterium]